MSQVKNIESRAFIEAEENALMDFQFALIDAMNERGINQAELSRILGVTRARVSQMLSSEANPTIKLVARALAALDVVASYSSKAPLETKSFVRPDFVGKQWEGNFGFVACQAVQMSRLWGNVSNAANENYHDRYELEAA